MPPAIRSPLRAATVLAIALLFLTAGAACAGKRGGILVAVAPDTGKRLATYRLSAPPTWDAMAAAGGRLFLATMDGKVTCMRGK